MMNDKDKLIWWLVASIAMFLVSLILYFVGREFDVIGQYLTTYSVVLFVLILVQAVMNGFRLFAIWKKLSLIYIPIMAVIVLLTGRGTGIMPIDSEIVTWWTAGLFLIISLGIIVYKKIKLGYR